MYTHVMVALRADLKITLQLGAVENLTTAVTLGPDPFRDTGFGTGVPVLLLRMRSIQLIDDLSV